MLLEAHHSSSKRRSCGPLAASCETQTHCLLGRMLPRGLAFDNAVFLPPTGTAGPAKQHCLADTWPWPLQLANILLTAEGRVKLADFGLAAVMESPDSERHTICGTPNYIAAGQRCTSARAACCSFCSLQKWVVVGGPCTATTVQQAAHGVAHLLGQTSYSTLDQIAAGQPCTVLWAAAFSMQGLLRPLLVCDTRRGRQNRPAAPVCSPCEAHTEPLSVRLLQRLPSSSPTPWQLTFGAWAWCSLPC